MPSCSSNGDKANEDSDTDERDTASAGPQAHSDVEGQSTAFDDSSTDSSQQADTNEAILENWQSAYNVEYFVNEDLRENPPSLTNPVAAEIGVSLRATKLSVVVGSNFWPSNTYYEILVKEESGSVYQILIKPKNIFPDGPYPNSGPFAGIMRFLLDEATPKNRVEIFRVFEYDPSVVKIGEQTAMAVPDCSLNETCGNDDDCSTSGSVYDGTAVPGKTCYQIDLCNGTFCASEDEYFWQTENIPAT